MTRLIALLGLFLTALAPAPASAQPSTLVTQLERLAAAGTGEAAYHLGMIYHLGLEGVSRDARRAFDLFRQAAERGDPLGAYKVGCFYDGQGGDVVALNPAEALRYKLIAAEAGYDLAQQDVANHYGAIGNWEAAARWLEASARQGNGQALMGLAALHRRDGPRPDPARAALYRSLIHANLVRTLAEAPLPRSPPGEEQITSEQVLAAFEQMLPSEATPEQRQQADALAQSWPIRPGALTERAGMGLEAARQLVAAAAAGGRPSF